MTCGSSNGKIFCRCCHDSRVSQTPALRGAATLNTGFRGGFSSHLTCYHNANKLPSTAYASVALKKIDVYNYEATEKLNGQMLGVVHWTISPDGETRTVMGTTKNAQGQTTNNVIVFDKQ